MGGDMNGTKHVLGKREAMVTSHQLASLEKSTGQNSRILPFEGPREVVRVRLRAPGHTQHLVLYLNFID